MIIVGAPPDAATRAKVVARMVANIAANDGRFTFGIVGSAWLFPMLGQYGHGDVSTTTQAIRQLLVMSRALFFSLTDCLSCMHKTLQRLMGPC